MKIRIGTRGSELALWQAKDLQSKLVNLGHEAEIIIIKTKGDEIQNVSLSKIEGKGFFTSEIEAELIADNIDVAVHSMKDLPTQMEEGLKIAGISPRADANDVLLVKKSSLDQSIDFFLKSNAKVGTSSNRRKCWINFYRPDVELVDIRGNVPTRINKLLTTDLDAIVLAAAGLNRLNIEVDDSIKRIDLKIQEFIPPPAQGIIAYQTRVSDEQTIEAIKSVSDKKLIPLVNIERRIMKALDAGCHSPLGAHCFKDANGFYQVYAGFAKTYQDNPVFIRKSSSTTLDLAEEIVKQLRSEV